MSSCLDVGLTPDCQPTIACSLGNFRGSENWPERGCILCFTRAMKQAKYAIF